MKNTCGCINVSSDVMPAGVTSWETPVGSNSDRGFLPLTARPQIRDRLYFVGDMMELEVIENPDYQNDDRIAFCPECGCSVHKKTGGIRYEAGNPLQKLHPGSKKDFSVGKIISWGIH